MTIEPRLRAAAADTYHAGESGSFVVAMSHVAIKGAKLPKIVTLRL
jgi:hypothetical protein